MVISGSIGLGTKAKRMRLPPLAAQERLLLVMIPEGAGERTSNLIRSQGHTPNDLQLLASIAGLVPAVAVMMPPSAGHGALTTMLLEF